MPFALIDRIEEVDPVVISAKTPKITQVLSANIKSPLIPTPVINTLYKTGAQIIRISGSGFPIDKMMLPFSNEENVRLIAVTVDSNSAKTQTALTDYVFKATEKELLVVLPNNVNENGVDGYIEFRHGMSDRPLLTYDIAMAAEPTA